MCDAQAAVVKQSCAHTVGQTLGTCEKPLQLLTVCIPTPPSSFVLTARMWLEKKDRYCWKPAGATARRTSIIDRRAGADLNRPNGSSLGTDVSFGDARVTFRNSSRFRSSSKPAVQRQQHSTNTVAGSMCVWVLAALCSSYRQTAGFATSMVAEQLDTL
jgi:hypothetical protein